MDEYIFESKDVRKILEDKGYEFTINDDWLQMFGYKHFITKIQFTDNIKPLIPESYYNKFEIYTHNGIMTIDRKIKCSINEFWELATYMARSLPNNPNKKYIDTSLAYEWTARNKSKELGLEIY